MLIMNLKILFPCRLDKSSFLTRPSLSLLPEFCLPQPSMKFSWSSFKTAFQQEESIFISGLGPLQSLHDLGQEGAEKEPTTVLAFTVTMEWLSASSFCETEITKLLLEFPCDNTACCCVPLGQT